MLQKFVRNTFYGQNDSNNNKELYLSENDLYSENLKWMTGLSMCVCTIVVQHL